jgi:hypothetical protein
VLEDSELSGNVLVKLAEIAYLEGEFDRAVGLFQQATPLIKKPLVWYSCAKGIFKCLNKLGKPASQERFLADLAKMVSEPIDSVLTQPSTFYELRALSVLLQMKYQFRQLSRQPGPEIFQRLKSLYKSLCGMLANMFRLDQLQMLSGLYLKMVAFCEQLNGPFALTFCRWLVQVGQSVDELVKGSLKYTLVMRTRSEFVNNPLALEGCRFRVLLARAYCLFGELKVKHKLDDTEGEPETSEQQPPEIRAFVQELTLQINEQLNNPSKSLGEFETAIAILTSLVNKFAKGSALYQ